MSYRCLLRRNADGVERWTPWHGLETQYEDSIIFSWTENNYCCDCNRSDEFARAAGEPEEEEADCGSERFTLLRMELSDGRFVDMPKANATWTTPSPLPAKNSRPNHPD